MKWDMGELQKTYDYLAEFCEWMLGDQAEIYLAGGSVRDFVLGLGSPNDLDVYILPKTPLGTFLEQLTWLEKVHDHWAEFASRHPYEEDSLEIVTHSATPAKQFREMVEGVLAAFEEGHLAGRVGIAKISDFSLRDPSKDLPHLVKKGKKIQLLCYLVPDKPIQTIEDLLSHFDFEFNKFAFDGKRIRMPEDLDEDLVVGMVTGNLPLKVNQVSTVTKNRIQKFAQRFNISCEQALQDLETFRSQSDAKGIFTMGSFLYYEDISPTTAPSHDTIDKIFSGLTDS